MNKLKSICVFCGARPGNDPSFVEEARKFGKLLAENSIRLVYGGGDCGIMGEVANSVMKAGGRVTGVFPVGLKNLENEHKGLSEIIIVDSMHERKFLMFEKSQAFVTFPGGFGTMDETFEIITWRQLRFHEKPVIMYNHKGYYDPWMGLIDSIIGNGFAGEEVREAFTVVNDIKDIVPTAERLM
jgi:uncharacterized protein (TIGR00730 family)